MGGTALIQTCDKYKMCTKPPIFDEMENILWNVGPYSIKTFPRSSLESYVIPVGPCLRHQDGR